MSEQYYPSLSSLIKIDDLPEQLNFLQTGVNGLAEVFDKVYYQNLEINHANSGAVSSAFARILRVNIWTSLWLIYLNKGGTPIKYTLARCERV